VGYTRRVSDATGQAAPVADGQRIPR
jgi:hypothetical protein